MLPTVTGPEISWLVVKLALPELSRETLVQGPIANSVFPDCELVRTLNPTLPVGMPADVPCTVAVSVTGWPLSCGFALDVIVVVVSGNDVISLALNFVTNEELTAPTIPFC